MQWWSLAQWCRGKECVAVRCNNGAQADCRRGDQVGGLSLDASITTHMAFLGLSIASVTFCYPWCAQLGLGLH